MKPPGCISERDFTIGHAIHWAPDGKSIIAFGVKQLGTFGIVRWRSSKPFSPNPDDWGSGEFVTDTSKTNQGVVDAALSPDGKTLALVSNQKGDTFRLFLAQPTDFLMTNVKATPVRACKIAWRGDSREIAVVQGDAQCSEGPGPIVRLPVSDPTQQRELNSNGDNPAYKPLPLGG
jgi:Tol biopolymer transport system component